MEYAQQELSLISSNQLGPVIMRHAEFFAGIGAVSRGLEGNWETVWANDIDPLKARVFHANNQHKQVDYQVCDIRTLHARDVPDVGLTSSTFPCTNSSCAGDRRGLLGIKSGVVYRYISLLEEKGGAKAIPYALLENPTGLIARNQGADLRDLIQRLAAIGYGACVSVVDAKHFVPQSRPRIFIVCAPLQEMERAGHLRPLAQLTNSPNGSLYTPPIWGWMKTNEDLPLFCVLNTDLPERQSTLSDVIDLDGDGWVSKDFEKGLLAGLSGKHIETFNRLVSADEVQIATVARRGRTRDNGERFNATELSCTGIAPCQRPYGGGSSRSWVLVAGNGKYAFKVITPRESARLMGLNDNFKLPENSKEAYQVTGDAVVPACVRWVDQNILTPIMCKTLDISATHTQHRAKRNR